MGRGSSKKSKASSFSYNRDTLERAFDSLRHEQHTNFADNNNAKDAIDALSWYISTGRSSPDFDRKLIDSDNNGLLSAITQKSGTTEEYVSRAKRFLNKPGAMRPDTFERFPVSVRLGGGTKEEKQKASQTVTSFLNGARIGEQYNVGGGVGSGGSGFSIVYHRRSPNGMGIKWDGSNRSAVALTRANAKNAIANGATKTKR